MLATMDLPRVRTAAEVEREAQEAADARSRDVGRQLKSVEAMIKQEFARGECTVRQRLPWHYKIQAALGELGYRVAMAVDDGYFVYTVTWPV